MTNEEIAAEIADLGSGDHKHFTEADFRRYAELSRELDLRKWKSDPVLTRFFDDPA